MRKLGMNRYNIHEDANTTRKEFKTIAQQY